MSGAEHVRHGKKPYTKPELFRRSAVEVAGLLREGLSMPLPVDKPRQPTGTIDGPVLLVEGYEGALQQVRRDLRGADLVVRSNSLKNGDGFIAIGFSGEQDSSLESSSLLVLDIRGGNRTNGRLFETITKHPKLQRVPVAILVDSADQIRGWTGRDPIECWRLQGRPNSEHLVRAFKCFLDLWRSSDELVLSDTRGR